MFWALLAQYELQTPRSLGLRCSRRVRRTSLCTVRLTRWCAQDKPSHSAGVPIRTARVIVTVCHASTVDLRFVHAIAPQCGRPSKHTDDVMEADATWDIAPQVTHAPATPSSSRRPMDLSADLNKHSTVLHLLANSTLERRLRCCAVLWDAGKCSGML